jgi:predicted Ser/Thr protein kinase
MSNAVLSHAVVIYTGRGISPFPVRSIERLAEHFVSLQAAELAPVVAGLDEEFYEVEPASGESLNAAADRAAAVFTSHHPELTAEAIDALRWCYTYDWK